MEKKRERSSPPLEFPFLQHTGTHHHLRPEVLSLLFSVQFSLLSRATITPTLPPPPPSTTYLFIHLKRWWCVRSQSA